MVAVAVAIAGAGCSDDGSKPSADSAKNVSVPMIDIPTRTDQEPRMRIPQPQGWERTTKLDSETIRFAIRNPALAAGRLHPQRGGDLQKIGLDVGKPKQILDARESAAADEAQSHRSQGHRRPGVWVVGRGHHLHRARHGQDPGQEGDVAGDRLPGGDANYVATVTVQAIKPDNGPTHGIRG